VERLVQLSGGTVTFVKVHAILKRITRRFVGNWFEHDELVNQAWLSPQVRNAETKHHVVRAGLNAVYDYMRHELGRRKNKGPQRLIIEPTVEDVASDVWIDFDSMSTGLSPTKKLIIKLRADWFTTDEIAKIVGIGKTTVKNEVATIKKDQKLRKCL
jgi:DNA-directed RNA polymerase specialized sigma24 family protein